MCLAYQSGSGTRFKYEHNPMDNPKAARDIIETQMQYMGFRLIQNQQELESTLIKLTGLILNRLRLQGKREKHTIM